MKIKLIIWDLDDTLWCGSLAEGDDVRPIESRFEWVRRFNACGIVSALCSKNDFETAKAKLESFGLFDAFVFPRLSFEPKAPVLRQMIADMQLRPVNVLFIDDHPGNLHEAKFLMPDLNVVDAASPACDELLEQIWEENKHIRKSRVEDYRLLERKHEAREIRGLSSEDFLRDSDLCVSVVYASAALPFAQRIEELVNRSNQLNYLKTRFEPGGAQASLAQTFSHHTFTVFAWDKYGYYGLVGFASIENERDISCFAFSCRVMHMGIEAWTLAQIKKRYPNVVTDAVPVEPLTPDWIHEKLYADGAVRAMILDKECGAPVPKADLRIMANCQAGALAHYGGLSPDAVENLGQHFSLACYLNGRAKDEIFPPYLVVATFVDYVRTLYSTPPRPEADIFRSCVRQFFAHAEAEDCTVLLIMAPEEAPPDKFYKHKRITPELMRGYNAIWREEAKAYPRVSLLEVGEMARPEELFDVRHFDVPLLKRIADRVAAWYARVSAEAKTDKIPA